MTSSGDDVADANVPLPLPNVTGRVLRLIIEFCTNDGSIFAPRRENDDEFVCYRRLDSYVRTFLMSNKKSLFDIIKASIFLDIEGLFEASCKFLASQIVKLLVESTMDDVRRLLNIQSDFIPEKTRLVSSQIATSVLALNFLE